MKLIKWSKINSIYFVIIPFIRNFFFWVLNFFQIKSGVTTVERCLKFVMSVAGFRVWSHGPQGPSFSPRTFNLLRQLVSYRTPDKRTSQTKPDQGSPRMSSRPRPQGPDPIPCSHLPSAPGRTLGVTLLLEIGVDKTV